MTADKSEKPPMDPRTVRILFLSGLLMMASCCRAAGTDTCTTKIRIDSIDFGEADNDFSNQSVTRFTEALSRQIVETSGLGYSIHSVPYARALRDFKYQRANVLIASETSVRTSGVKAVGIPLFFIEMSSYRMVEQPSEGRAGGVVGILNGMTLPDRYVKQHRRAYYTDTYDSLFNMLAAHHLDEILVARPRADIYLSNHPDLKARISQPALVERQTVAVHLYPSIGQDCISRLSASVEKTRGESMTAIAARYLPGVQTAEFLIPSTSTLPGSVPVPMRNSPVHGPRMANDARAWLACTFKIRLAPNDPQS